MGTSGSTQDYGMRIYNPSLGRFLSVDPLTKEYAHYTPYQYAGNKPIKCVDVDGLEELPNEIFEAAKTAGKNLMKKTTEYVINKAVESILYFAAEKTAEKIQEKTTPAQAQEIGLTLEFIGGFGPRERNFGPSAPITQSLKGSNMTTEALKAFDKGYQDFKGGKRKDIPSQYRVDFSYFYPFGGDTGPFKEYSKDGWTSAQFVGTAIFNFSLSEDKKTLNVHVYDTKNEYSFLGHMPGTDKHSRDEMPIMGETTQTYDFTISLDEVSKRVNEGKKK